VGYDSTWKVYCRQTPKGKGKEVSEKMDCGKEKQEKHQSS